MPTVLDRLTGLGYDVFERRSSAYILLEGPLSWRQARRQARRLGGDLTTISGPRENDFITRKFSPLAADPCGLWIGLNAIQTPEKFRWSDGRTSGYRNFIKPGSPGYSNGLTLDDPTKPYVHIYFNPDNLGFWKNSDNTYRDVMLGGGIAEFAL